MMILELCVEELSRGVLASEFAKGAVAAILHYKGAYCQLWSQLMEDTEEQLPWEAPLVDIARNHHGSTDITLTLGDAFYFQPEQHGYISRKMEIARVGPDGSFDVQPPQFFQGQEIFHPRPEALSSCWSIVEDIMLALTPEGREERDYRVAVQRLKYQPRWADFSKLMDMTENSLGRWARLGFALDRSRQRAAGMLSHKGPSDLLGMLMMVPLIGEGIAALNARIARYDRVRRIGPGERIIEKAHHDLRYFSGLCGTRDTIRTEVFFEGAWVELPVGPDCIAVFPGNLAAHYFGLRPTLHRVIHTGDSSPDQNGDARTRNVTILIGAV